ncbi:MAG: sterol desaturase family protein [Bdellovibrionaceae bacterium]|nr:sterol desaturase family protein [Pseudobdellovibrionaceae bacterium]
MVKAFLKNHLFLWLVLLVVGADTLLWYFKFSPGQWIEYTYNGAALILILFELLIPRNSSWNLITCNGIKFRETIVEAFFFFWSGFFASTVTYAFSDWAADHIRSYLHITSQVSVHWIFQGLMIVFGIDLLRYWLHRWMHKNPFLWRFHALHHMPERLGTLTSTRTHPVDDFILYVPELIFLFTLGFDRVVVASLYSVIWVISLVKHSNIEFPATVFSRHFQLPRYHLIHHNYQDDKSPTYNFSEVLTFWDKVFGTYKDHPIQTTHRVGVASEKPRSFLREFFGWLVLPVQRM